MVNSVYYNSKKYYNVTDKVDIDNGDKTGTIVTLSDSDFVSVVAPTMGETDFHTAWRNADGTINTNGFMQLASSSAFVGLGADFNDYQATQSPATLPNGNTTVVTTTVTTANTTKATDSATVTDTEDSTTNDVEPAVTTTPVNSYTEPAVTTTPITSTAVDDIATAVGKITAINGDTVVVETDGKSFEIPKDDLADDVAVGQSVLFKYDSLTDSYIQDTANVVDSDTTIATTTSGTDSASTDGNQTSSEDGLTTTADGNSEPDDTTTTTAQQSGDGDTSNVQGDASLDGEVQANDVLLIKKHLLGISTLEGQASTNADINGDGEVMANDLLWVKKVVLGIWSDFSEVTKA
jgi:hypothetical protein